MRETRKNIQTLCKWRNNALFAFTDQTPTTYAKTKKWLHKLNANPKRILFFITHEGKQIGHIGLSTEQGYLELDNVLRGEKEGKGKMGEAVDDMVKIAKMLGKKITVRVVPNNSHAIAFYIQHRFKITKKDTQYLYLQQ